AVPLLRPHYCARSNPTYTYYWPDRIGNDVRSLMMFGRGWLLTPPAARRCLASARRILRSIAVERKAGAHGRCVSSLAPRSGWRPPDDLRPVRYDAIFDPIPVPPTPLGSESGPVPQLTHLRLVDLQGEHATVIEAKPSLAGGRAGGS